MARCGHDSRVRHAESLILTFAAIVRFERVLVSSFPAASVQNPPSLTVSYNLTSVVELVPNPSPLPCDARLFSRVTQEAFGQRRKMLRQSLKNLGVEPLALPEATRIERRAMPCRRAGTGLSSKPRGTSRRARIPARAAHDTPDGLWQKDRPRSGCRNLGALLDLGSTPLAGG